MLRCCHFVSSSRQSRRVGYGNTEGQIVRRAQGGGSAPWRRSAHIRDVNSALGKRQLPPPKNPARLTLHGSPKAEPTPSLDNAASTRQKGLFLIFPSHIHPNLLCWGNP
ncbi:hypothetical protein INR49_017134 [Caranx melampygus]|nr:hypothetical protein INR49_017134 [Caranx melampygus]